MQHISKNLKNYPLETESESPTDSRLMTNSPSSIAQPPAYSDKTRQFWAAMGDIYGTQWINSFGDKPKPMWIAEIERLTAQEISFGIEQCKRSGSPFIPNLPQFLALCDPYSSYTAEQRAFYARTQGGNEPKELPKPPPNPEIKRAALAEIKSTLGMPETKKPEL